MTADDRGRRAAANQAMNSYFSEESTQPLPLHQREPLILVIDELVERRIWVSNLLTYAHYLTHTTSSPRDTFIWYVQHQTVIHTLLLGDIAPQEHFIVQRLVQRINSYQRTDMPIFSLSAYFPQVTRIGSLPFTARSQGGFALLEALWLGVARQGK